MAATTVPELAGVRRASDLALPVAGAGADRLLPVAPELHPLLPGLRRGGSVAVSGGTSVVLALLARASAEGAWCAVVGLPRLGLLAASQAGIALERLALVPHPGPEWTTVVAALLDGVEVVVVAPPGPVPGRAASRLVARARQRGGVLVSCGPWPGAELTLSVEQQEWDGLGVGRGRLRCREVTIAASGRGAAARPRRVRVRLPGPAGRLAAVPSGGGRLAAVPPAGGRLVAVPDTDPADRRGAARVAARPATVPVATDRCAAATVTARPAKASVGAHLAAAPATGRPRLTVVDGGGGSPVRGGRTAPPASQVERTSQHGIHPLQPSGVHAAEVSGQPFPPEEGQ